VARVSRNRVIFIKNKKKGSGGKNRKKDRNRKNIFN
jgi:hypothetical protein